MMIIVNLFLFQPPSMTNNQKKTISLSEGQRYGYVKTIPSKFGRYLICYFYLLYINNPYKILAL